MTIDVDGLKISAHEAAHVCAALAVGRRVLSVTRAGSGGYAHGFTHSEAKDKESVEEALIVLLAAVYVEPRGADNDVKKAHWLASLTPDPEGVMRRAEDQVRELIREDDFRRMHTAVEQALWSRTTLSGWDITCLLAEVEMLA